ncbi:MAG: hypothetical protein ACO1RT_02435 [Planctomycetaceae bacterium]
MSQTNPYTSSMHVSAQQATSIRQVQVKPIELLKRGYALIRGQYWLFLGVTIVGLLIGSAVPLGLLLGPMLVGIYLCYAERESGRPAEFGTLFKGFDDFVSSFVAVLILMGVSLVAMLPFLIAMFVLVFIPIINAQAAGANAPPPDLPIGVLLLYPLMIAVNVLVTMPFLFAFQLIADRKLAAVEAVKTSVSGVLRNFMGVLGFMIVLAVVNVALTLMCYLPVIFFLPISFGAMFALYRDIFPKVAYA